MKFTARGFIIWLVVLLADYLGDLSTVGNLWDRTTGWDAAIYRLLALFGG